LLSTKPLGRALGQQARAKAANAYAPELEVVIDPPRLANLSAKKNEVA
jgi:hypothetical protein